MNMLLQVFYILPVFMMIYLLYEIIDYKRTKKFLGAIVTSIIDDAPIPSDYGTQFLVDFLAFLWTVVSILIAIFNGMWLIFWLSLSIIVVGLVQMALTINIAKRGKSVVRAYYITTMMLFGLFVSIVLILNPLDLL